MLRNSWTRDPALAAATVDLTTVFSRYPDRRWIAVQPGGNWGDHLIYMGADKLAKSANINWEVTDYRLFPSMRIEPGTCIFLHGSGGLNSWSSGRAFDNLAHAVRVPGATVVQGPQTCETGNPRISERFTSMLRDAECDSLTILAREVDSWRYLREVLPASVTVGLAEDTALALDKEDLIVSAGLSAAPDGRYDLLILRQDNENPGSRFAGHTAKLVMDPAVYADSFRHWLRIHLYARSIVSNRLHSAIAGSIAEIPTTLCPGSYHKNQSVWDYSLAARGVHWADNVPQAGERDFDLVAICPRFIRNSWKFQRLVYRLRGMPSA